MQIDYDKLNKVNNQSNRKIRFITIFSLDLEDHFSQPLHQMCLDSWYEWKNNNKQIKNIIIFNEDSQEYKDFLTIFLSNPYNRTNTIPRRLANGFRMYILSKYKNYLWLDSDMYINDVNFEWKADMLFSGISWNIAFNGDQLDFFKDIFNLFLTENLGTLIDWEISLKYNLPFISFNKLLHNNCFTHLSKFDLGRRCFSISYNENNSKEIIKCYNNIKKAENEYYEHFNSDKSWYFKFIYYKMRNLIKHISFITSVVLENYDNFYLRYMPDDLKNKLRLLQIKYPDKYQYKLEYLNSELSWINRNINTINFLGNMLDNRQDMSDDSIIYNFLKYINSPLANLLENKYITISETKYILNVGELTGEELITKLTIFFIDN